MAMTTTERQCIARVFACALGLAGLASCGSKPVSRDATEEIAALKSQMAQLEKRLDQRDSYRPTVEEREAAAKQAVGKIEERVLVEKPSYDEIATKKAGAALQTALKPDLGTVEIRCYKTTCEATTTHPSTEAYQAFIKAAFRPDPKTGLVAYPAWFVANPTVSADGIRAAHLYVGRIDQLPPMRVPPPVQNPSKTPR